VRSNSVTPSWPSRLAIVWLNHRLGALQLAPGGGKAALIGRRDKNPDLVERNAVEHPSVLTMADIEIYRLSRCCAATYIDGSRTRRAGGTGSPTPPKGLPR